MPAASHPEERSDEGSMRFVCATTGSRTDRIYLSPWMPAPLADSVKEVLNDIAGPDNSAFPAPR